MEARVVRDSHQQQQQDGQLVLVRLPKMKKQSDMNGLSKAAFIHSLNLDNLGIRMIG